MRGLNVWCIGSKPVVTWGIYYHRGISILGHKSNTEKIRSYVFKIENTMLTSVLRTPCPTVVSSSSDMERWIHTSPDTVDPKTLVRYCKCITVVDDYVKSLVYIGTTIHCGPT